MSDLAAAADVALRVYEGALRSCLLLYASYSAFKALAPAPVPRASTPVEPDAPPPVTAEHEGAEEKSPRGSPSPNGTDASSEGGSTIDDETATQYRDNETVSPSKRCATADAPAGFNVEDDDDDELKTVRFADNALESRYPIEVEDDDASSRATSTAESRQEVLRDFIVVSSILFLGALGASDSARALLTTVVALVAVTRPANLDAVYDSLLVPVFESAELVMFKVYRKLATALVRACTAGFVAMVRLVAEGLSSKELERTETSVDACLAHVRSAARAVETSELKASSALRPASRKPRSRAGRMRASVPF